MSNDVMIDIETLAKSERAVVLSIGAIAFDAEKFGEDIETLPSFYTALAFEDQKDRDIDLGTVRWWMNQAADAQHAAFTTDRDERKSTRTGLLDFGRFVMYNGGSTVNVWAKSPSFDLNILATLFADFDQFPPWKYSQERDVRTIIDVAGTPNLPGLHEPLDDCAIQISMVRSAYAKLKGEEIRFVTEPTDGPNGGEFVEVEDIHGASIGIGNWRDRDDGLKELRVPGVRR